MSTFQINLAQFTGPLDLLLHLVRVSEMDIFDLDVAVITEQYLAIIEREGVRDLAGAYQFLALAATLVELKSRMLLPRPEQPPAEDGEEGAPPEDPRAQLAAQLAAYQSIQDVTADLALRYEQTGRHWPRQVVEQLEAEVVYTLDELSIYDLMVAFEEVLSRPRFHQITIFQEDYAAEDARQWLTGRLRDGSIELRALLYEQRDVFTLIVTFVALLELIKEEQVTFEKTELGIAISLAAAA